MASGLNVRLLVIRHVGVSTFVVFKFVCKGRGHRYTCTHTVLINIFLLLGKSSCTNQSRTFEYFFTTMCYGKRIFEQKKKMIYSQYQIYQNLLHIIFINHMIQNMTDKRFC